MARPGRDGGERFGVSAESDGKAVGKIWADRTLGLQQRAKVTANLLGVHRAKRAVKIERGHQPYRADRKLRGVQNGVIAEHADFQAAAAEIGDTAGLAVRAEGVEDRFPAEARFFQSADHFKANAGAQTHLLHKCFAVGGFARGAGGYSAIGGDGKFVQHIAKMAKRFDTFLDDVFAETVADEDAFAQTQRIAFTVQRFNI